MRIASFSGTRAALVWVMTAAVPGSSATAADVGETSAPARMISGRVTTQSGEPLAGVRVTIPEARRQTTTDPEGRYAIADLPSGRYQISFTATGYAPEARRVTLSERDLTLDIQMKPSAVELPAVQVTGTPGATSALETPQPIAVMSDAELRNVQAPSLGETLSQLPGLRNLSTGAGVGKPVIRGLTSNRVLILDGGQRLETQQWGDEHGPDISTSDAQRIEVIRGPQSVLYGSDALGGVINVIPREAPDDWARTLCGRVPQRRVRHQRAPARGHPGPGRRERRPGLPRQRHRTHRRRGPHAQVRAVEQRQSEHRRAVAC